MVTAEDILKPSSLLPHKTIFTIGPFGRPVSFVYQQQRALSLVWALEERKFIKPNTSVAVVGAGLAGLSAATALTSRKCHVSLYEKASHALSIQQPAHHRLIHPTVNFWPFVQHTSTTRFPFLDWHVGMCAETVQELRDTWTASYKNQLTARYFYTEVVSVKQNPNGRVTVHSTGHHSEPEEFFRDATRESYEYDVVIIATGFGLERDLDSSDADTYWRIDKIDEYKDDPSKKSFVLSGTGDGGLIDTIRLLHRDYRKGRIALRLMERLRSEHAALEFIKQIESDARLQSDPDTGSPDLDLIARNLGKGYSEVARLLPPPIKEELKVSLLKGRRVTLVGSYSAPFQPDAAPIYKLLIANALLEQRLIYSQGRVSRREDRQVVVDTLDGRWWKWLLGSTMKKLDADVYIARHGAPPPLCSIVDGVVESRLRLKQLWLSNHLASPDWGGRYFENSTPGRCNDDPQSKCFIEARAALVKKYLAKYYEHPPPEVREHAPGRFSYVLDIRKCRDEALSEIGGREATIFGTPVIYEGDDLIVTPATA